MPYVLFAGACKKKVRRKHEMIWSFICSGLHLCHDVHIKYGLSVNLLKWRWAADSDHIKNDSNESAGIRSDQQISDEVSGEETLFWCSLTSTF